MTYTFQSHLKQLVLNKAARVGHTISQREVAEDTGLSQPTVSKWFSGRMDRIEADTVGKLCAYLECKMTDLITFQSSAQASESVA